MSPEASRITGITVHRGKVFVGGKEVLAKSIVECLTDFCVWIAKIDKPLLVAHNGKTFDTVVLCRSLQSLTDRFKDAVAGFADSLPLFRLAFPGQASYKQEHLVRSILDVAYNAHDALADTKSLQMLLQHPSINRASLLKHSFSVEYVEACIVSRKVTAKNLSTLLPIVNAVGLSESMARKVAKSGLSMAHLKMAFARGGEDGVCAVFRDNVGQGPRVTKQRAIADRVCMCLQNMPES
jgi:DNA polymerase III alpha subunit (gram-positive type)